MSFSFNLPKKIQSTKDDDSLTASEQVVGKTTELKDSLSTIKPLSTITGLKNLAIKPITALAKPAATQVKPATTQPKLESSELINIADEALGILNSMPTISYKDAMKETVDLDELAKEFQNEEQPDKFEDSATQAVHNAVLELEKSIDNAEEVRTQLTLIMNEIQKYPQVAAKICDTDIHIMVKALRQSYNTVAFTKKINKSKSESAKKKSLEKVADILNEDLFEGLGI